MESNATFTDKTGTLNCGEDVVVNCDTGYNGTITATCNSNGGWSYSGSCATKTCQNSQLNFTCKVSLPQKTTQSQVLEITPWSSFEDGSVLLSTTMYL